MKNKFYLSLFLLILASLLSYANIVNNKFLFDDTTTIENNRVIDDIGNIKILFSKQYFARSGVGDFTVSGEGSYRPLVTMTYFIDCFLWGKNHFALHLTNLIFHILSVLMLYLMLRNLLKNNRIALFAGLIYSVHPILSEAVNCVSFREDLMCAFFMFAAIYFHNKKFKLKSLIAATCYLLGLFSKEMCLIFLPLIILVDFAQQRKKFVPRISDYGLFFLVTLFFCVIRFYLMDNPSSYELKYAHENIFLNVMDQLIIFSQYLKLILYPFTLTVDYTMKIPPKTLSFENILSVCFLLVILFYSVWGYLRGNKNKTAYYIGMIFLFFVSLLPVSNIILLKNVIAERYLYFPFAFVTVSFAFFLSMSPKRVQLCLIVFLIVIFSGVSMQRNDVWSDSYKLWSDTLSVNPKSFHAHNNLASWYDEHNMYQKAQKHYQKAIKIRPDDNLPYYNLGNTLKQLGKYGNAIYCYKESIKRDPTFIEPYVNLGLTYAETGNKVQAIRYFKKAIKINYNDSSAHNNLGVVLGIMGKLDEAVIEHELAIKFNPKNENAYSNLVLCYIDKKDYRKALDILKLLVKLNPTNTKTYFLMAMCWESLNINQKANLCYKRILQIDPNNQRALELLKRSLN